MLVPVQPALPSRTPDLDLLDNGDAAVVQYMLDNLEHTQDYADAMPVLTKASETDSDVVDDFAGQQIRHALITYEEAVRQALTPMGADRMLRQGSGILDVLRSSLTTQHVWENE